MKNKKHKTLLFAGASTGLNNFVMATTPAAEEFRHSSPVLIISNTNKNSGRKQVMLFGVSGGNVLRVTTLDLIYESITLGSGAKAD